MKIKSKKIQYTLNITSSKPKKFYPCSQLLWAPTRLQLMADAYHKEKGATPHPGEHKHSLQYDRSDGRLAVRVWMWNLGSLMEMETFGKN